MKKFLIALAAFVFIFPLVSCDREQNYEKEDSTMDIAFQSGIYYDKNWAERIGTYQNDAIPDKETAIAVAKQIFYGMKKSAEAEKFTVQSVFYDEVDEIWIVSFWEDRGSDYDGNDCSIALRKNDCKVLRIWFGE